MSKLSFYLPVLGFVFVAIALWRGLYLDTKTLPSMLIDKPMPNFELTSVEGSGVSNLDLPDQIFLLNVWGSYCLPCLIEHPTLMRLSEEGEIPVVGVNYRDQQGLATDWLADNGNPFSFSILDESGRFGIDLGCLWCTRNLPSGFERRHSLSACERARRISLAREIPAGDS